MILRHRQIGGIPLTKGQGVIFTLFGAMSVALIARFFWIPFFDFAEEFQKPFLLIGVLTYIVSCAGIVEQDHERAQLFMGSYTGISFPAGIYFLPRLPFPLISVALHVLFSFFNQEVALYLGWTLKGSVSVASIVVETTAEGMTSDGVRVDVKVTLILEIEDTAVFLSQTKGDSDRAPLLQAISSQSSARIKQRVIAEHTVIQLNQGDYETGYEGVNVWITEACSFVKEFGLCLSQSPIVQVEIMSEQVRGVLDAHTSAALFAKNAIAVGKSFAEFQKEVPGLSEEMAMVLFSQARAAKDGIPRTNIDVFKIK